MILIGTMGEIQARHVHTGLAKADHNLFGIGGGTDGADDFGFSHNWFLHVAIRRYYYTTFVILYHFCNEMQRKSVICVLQYLLHQEKQKRP